MKELEKESKSDLKHSTSSENSKENLAEQKPKTKYKVLLPDFKLTDLSKLGHSRSYKYRYSAVIGLSPPVDLSDQNHQITSGKLEAIIAKLKPVGISVLSVFHGGGLLAIHIKIRSILENQILSDEECQVKAKANEESWLREHKTILERFKIKVHRSSDLMKDKEFPTILKKIEKKYQEDKDYKTLIHDFGDSFLETSRRYGEVRELLSNQDDVIKHKTIMELIYQYVKYELVCFVMLAVGYLSESPIIEKYGYNYFAYPERPEVKLLKDLISQSIFYGFSEEDLSQTHLRWVSLRTKPIQKTKQINKQKKLNNKPEETKEGLLLPDKSMQMPLETDSKLSIRKASEPIPIEIKEKEKIEKLINKSQSAESFFGKPKNQSKLKSDNIKPEVIPQTPSPPGTPRKYFVEGSSPEESSIPASPPQTPPKRSRTLPLLENKNEKMQLDQNSVAIVASSDYQKFSAPISVDLLNPQGEAKKKKTEAVDVCKVNFRRAIFRDNVIFPFLALLNLKMPGLFASIATKFTTIFDALSHMNSEQLGEFLSKLETARNLEEKALDEKTSPSTVKSLDTKHSLSYQCFKKINWKPSYYLKPENPWLLPTVIWTLELMDKLPNNCLNFLWICFNETQLWNIFHAKIELACNTANEILDEKARQHLISDLCLEFGLFQKIPESTCLIKISSNNSTKEVDNSEEIASRSLIS